MSIVGVFKFYSLQLQLGDVESCVQGNFYLYVSCDSYVCRSSGLKNNGSQ